MAKAPIKPPYVQTPAVPKKRIAGTNPMGSVGVGSYVAPTAPAKAPGRLRGTGPAAPHGYGHTFKQRLGHLRFSGRTGAVRIGKK